MPGDRDARLQKDIALMQAALVRSSKLAHFAHLNWPTCTSPDVRIRGMDRRQKAELFEVIRRGYADGETILGLSRKHGVHGGWCGKRSGARFLPSEKR